MSLIYPKIRNCSLVWLFCLFVTVGEISLLYFSLKYFIFYYSEYQSAWLMLFVIINNSFLFGLKLFTFISQGVPPNKNITKIFIFFNLILCSVFCIIESFVRIDLLAVILGIIMQIVSTMYQFDNQQSRSVTSTNFSIVYEV